MRDESSQGDLYPAKRVCVSYQQDMPYRGDPQYSLSVLSVQYVGHVLLRTIAEI